MPLLDGLVTRLLIASVRFNVVQVSARQVAA